MFLNQICVVPAAWSTACGFGDAELRLRVISIRKANGWTFAKVEHPSGFGEWMVNVEMRDATLLTVNVATAEDLAALRSYAIEFGPKWKDSLALDWYHARAHGKRGAILHGVRNNFGPSWLDAFEFADPIAWPNLRKEKTPMLRNMRVALSLHSWNNSDEENIRLGAVKRELHRRGTW